MHKILQTHLLRGFVANLKIDTIYALYPESFCDKNLAIWKVFAFCDSANTTAHDDENGQIANKKCDLAASKVLSKIVAERSQFPLPGVCSPI